MIEGNGCTSPPSAFSNADLASIRDGADAWTASTSGVVKFVECADPGCAGEKRFLTIVPSCKNQAYTLEQTPTGNQYLALKANLSSWEILHELGHVVGFPHTFERADRDRYVGFSNDAFCEEQTSNINSVFTCMSPTSSSNVGRPPLAPGSFGPYFEESVMNYITPNVCEKNGLEPDWDTALPAADGSAAIEIYRTVDYWSPFVPMGKSVGADQPLDYTLAPGGVSMVGSPAVATWGHPYLHAFARGENGHLYWSEKVLLGSQFVSWSAWNDLGDAIASDPAAVSPSAGKIALVARRSGGAVHLREYNEQNGWAAWQSLGQPLVGAASAPAISSWGTNRVDVFIRGVDNRLYSRTRTSSAWGGWTVRGNGVFQGKPTAVSWGPGRIDVFVRGMDNALWQIGYANAWGDFGSLGGTIVGSPAASSVAPGRLDVFFRGADQRLWQKALINSAWTGFIPLGGTLNGDPATTAHSNYKQTIEIIAPILDHNSHGLWWRWSNYIRPCYHGLGCGVCSE